MTAVAETDSARCAALFVAVQQRDVVGDGAIREAINRAIGEFGVNGCTARVAEEFGDHPDTAVPRMRWARAVVAQTFTRAQQQARNVANGRRGDGSPPPTSPR